MKFLKSKTIIGIMAIVLGIAICFILTPIYSKSLENKIKIVQVVKAIPKGARISTEDVKTVDIGSYNLPQAVLTNINDAVGMYATTDLFQEDFLLPGKLSVTPLSNNDYLENLDGLYGAMSITLQSFASGLSGKLLGGDIISVIATDSNENITVIPPELRYVKVLTCTTGEGSDVDPGAGKGEADKEKNIPTTVTLLVNERQAKSLANLEAMQRIHITLIYRGEEEVCRQYLEKQNEVLEQLKKMEGSAVIIDPATGENSSDLEEEYMEQEDLNDD